MAPRNIRLAFVVSFHVSRITPIDAAKLPERLLVARVEGLSAALVEQAHTRLDVQVGSRCFDHVATKKLD